MVNLYLAHMLLEHAEYQKLLSKVDFLFVPLANPGKFQQMFVLKINLMRWNFKMDSFTPTQPIATGTRTAEASVQTALASTSIGTLTSNTLLEMM